MDHYNHKENLTMKRILSVLLIAVCLCTVLVMPAAAENAMSATFQDALQLLDHFYDYDARYMIRIANYYFVSWENDNLGPVTVSAEEYEAVLHKHFVLSNAQLEAVRNYGYDLTYDADAGTYTVTMPGGFGGFMAERVYAGYVQNGATYDVFYAHQTFQYLDDVLAAEGKTQDEVLGGEYPDTFEYGGFVYKDYMGRYYTVASVDDYGRKYTVEMNGDTVRIISCADYTAADLPGTFDDHTHEYTGIVTLPTCTAEGYTTYSCACGDSYVADRVPAAEHEWNFGTVTVQPTETVGGSILYSCYNCDASKTESLNALGDLAARFRSALDRLDTLYNGYIGSGIMSFVVNNYFTTMENHLQNPAIVPADRYEEALRMHFYVTDARLESIHRLDFYDSETQTYSLTYIGGMGGGPFSRRYYGYARNGETYDVYFRSIIRHSLKEILKAEGKTLSDVIGTTQPWTVMYNGLVFERTVNDYVAIEYPAEHTGRKYTVEMNGDIVRIIDAADYTEADLPEVFDDVVAHEHKYAAVVTPPTCTEDGYTTYTCACGDSYTGDTVKAGHDWDYGTVTLQPTETASGVMIYSCSNCDTDRVESIYPLGNLAEHLQSGVSGWDNAYDTLGPVHLMIERVFYSYFFTEGSYSPVTVPAAKYEAALNNHFAVDDATLAAIRNSSSAKYDAATETYTVKFMGGIGGWMKPREYYGYVKNGDTYDVYYREIPYVFLEDVLAEEGKALPDVIGGARPSEVVYNGVTYKDGPDGYFVIAETAENRGKVHTVELNGDIVRILSTKAYTEADLPGEFDDCIAHEHTYTSAVTAPTCTEAGYTTYSCACGDSYTADTVPAVGHTYESVVTAPTCTAEGYTTHTCACGDSYTDTKTDVLGHTWDEGVLTLSPTETKEGEKTYTCSVCKATEKKSVAPLTHTHSYETVVTAPTCTAEGYTTYTCTCGDSYTADKTDALGHAYGTWTQTKAPTYTDAGAESRTCQTCGDTETRAIAVLAEPDVIVQDGVTYHVPADSAVTVPENDCFEEDTVVKIEEILSGDVFDTVVTAMMSVAEKYVAYEFTAEKDNVSVQPEGKLTVTFAIPDGYSVNVTVYFMAKDGKLEPLNTTVDVSARTATAELEHFSTYIVVDEDSEPHKHEYASAVTAPTCTEDGYTTYTCACGDSYTDDKVSALGHSFGAWSETKAPSADAAGEETRTCEACGATETREIATLTPSDSDETEPAETEPTDTAADSGASGNTGIIIAVIAAVLALGVAVLLLTRRKRA